MSDTSFTPLVAARWLARVAASDGAITPSERKVLSEFAKPMVLPMLKPLDLPTACQMILSKELKIVHSNKKKECIIKNQMAFALDGW